LTTRAITRKHWPALAACAFLLLFHWRGLTTWFYQDDFGWLHLGPATGFSDFLAILFAPKAHGNLRPWSENLYFYGLHAVFGMQAWPFRVVVFATVIASLFLICAIVRRLTGSDLAAFAASVFWLVNPTVATALCWSSIYNQTQSLCFLLLAFLLFLQGRYRAQIVVFILGLGSLETVVVYPLIVSLYAILYRRDLLRRTLPLYAISAAYAVLHFWIAPAAATGPYALRFDSRMPATLWNYIELALGAERFGHFYWDVPRWMITLGTIVIGAGVIAAIAFARRPALFGAGWFLALLAPVLALPEHILDYLLTGPALGFAIVLAAPFATRRRAWFAPLALLYLTVSLPASWSAVTWNRQRSFVSRRFVNAVVEAARPYRGQTLLLTGLNTEEFDAAYSNIPFDLYGLGDVYLAPGAAEGLPPAARLYVIPAGKLVPLRDAGKITVLNVSAGRYW
jgi:hypothetical protein